MCKMHKIAGILIAAVLSFVLIMGIACTESTTPETTATPTGTTTPVEPIELVYASYIPESMVHSQIDKWFMSEVTRRTNGQVTWTTYWAGSLLATMDLIEGTGTGVADVSIISFAYFPNELPLHQAFLLPTLTKYPPALGDAMNVLNTSYEPLVDELAKFNVKVLYTQWIPSNIIATKEPVRTLNDLRGIELRSYGYSDKVASKVDIIPVSLVTAEIYEALQRGIVDGTIGNHFAYYVSAGYHKIAPYVLDIDYGNFAEMTN